MSRLRKRWVSVLLLAMLAFSQASFALAGCVMERGELSQVMSGEGSHDCCNETGAGELPASANGCVSHCTADLQLLGQPGDLVQAPMEVLVVHVSRPNRAVMVSEAVDFPPPRSISPRILLHSFQV